MRSIEFDMVAMSLMALGVIFTSGVMLLIGYSKASRTGRPDRPASAEEARSHRRESEVTASQPGDRTRASAVRG